MKRCEKSRFPDLSPLAWPRNNGLCVNFEEFEIYLEESFWAIKSFEAGLTIIKLTLRSDIEDVGLNGEM